MKNLYEGFTEIDKDGNVVPALAVRWEAHPDNKGFRFHLRKGVKFHSGREFTAKDVKWTFEQILLPGNKGGLTLTYLKVLEGAQEIQEGKATQLSGVKVVDPYTVEVRFTAPGRAVPDLSLPVHGQRDRARSTAPTGTRRSRRAPARSSSCTGSAGRRSGWPPTRTTGAGRRRSTRSSMLIVPSYDTAVSMYEANELDVVDLEAIQAAARAEGSRSSRTRSWPCRPPRSATWA